MLFINSITQLSLVGRYVIKKQFKEPISNEVNLDEGQNNIEKLKIEMTKKERKKNKQLTS